MKTYLTGQEVDCLSALWGGCEPSDDLCDCLQIAMLIEYRYVGDRIQMEWTGLGVKLANELKIGKYRVDSSDDRRTWYVFGEAQ